MYPFEVLWATFFSILKWEQQVSNHLVWRWCFKTKQNTIMQLWWHWNRGIVFQQFGFGFEIWSNIVHCNSLDNPHASIWFKKTINIWKKFSSFMFWRIRALMSLKRDLSIPLAKEGSLQYSFTLLYRKNLKWKFRLDFVTWGYVQISWKDM